MQAAAEVYRSLGAEVVELSLPELKFALPVYYILACAEASSNLARYDGIRYGYRTEHYNGVNDMICQDPLRGLRPRGPAADSSGQLRPELRLLRRLLQKSPEPPGDHCPGL